MQFNKNTTTAVSTGDWYDLMSLDLAPGYTVGNKFGRNPDVDIAAAEDVWEGGGDYTGFPTITPEKVTVTSDSANDTFGGTGATVVRIWGFKTTSATLYEFENITMAGLSGADSVYTWNRINRIEVLTAGSANTNVGTITVKHKVTTSNVFGTVTPNYGQSQILAMSVPIGSTMLLKTITLMATNSNVIGDSGTATIAIMKRIINSSVFRAIRVYDISTTSNLVEHPHGGIPLEGGTDIKVRVLNVSDDNTTVSGVFDYIWVT